MVNAALSQVATLLDVSRMREVLADHVFAGVRLSSCRILHFRYKPGRTWIVSYAVRTAQAADEQMVYLRACERRGSAARYARSLALKQNVQHIPALDSVAWLFPSDRKLAGLPELSNAGRVRADVLPAIATAAFGPEWLVKNATSEIVHYLPERSCMVRFDVTLTGPDNSREISVAFYGKAYPDGQGAETFRYMAELWDCLHGAAPIAQPLLYGPEAAILWQFGLEGARLDLRNAAALTSAAEALAALHATHVSGLPAHPRFSTRLDEAAEVIAAAAPEQREHTLEFVTRLRELRPHLAARPAATLHGDLHLKNFIVTARGVALIDLDTLALGDPLEDLASFAAALYSAGLAGGVPEDHTRRDAANFIAAYERSSGWHIPELDLNWHIAAALITERALRAVTRMKADQPSLEALLHLASSFVAAAGQSVAGMEAFA